MSKPLQNPPPGFDRLSVDEQIDYLQSLWDRVTADADKVPIPGWHADIVRKRLSELEADSDCAIPWERSRENVAHRLREK